MDGTKIAGIVLRRTDSSDPVFRELVSLLDAELAERDGAEHSFYSQYNTVSAIRHVIVATIRDQALSCGAIKAFSDEAMEVKRMYTKPAYRGQGVAKKVLRELETWAHELGYRSCVLETGKRQPEAIALYLSAGYGIIPNYGQYAGVENSVCFKKLV